jgi:hypothetical protein
MGADPLERFLDYQRRCLAHHDFYGFKAEHYIQPTPCQVDMGVADDPSRATEYGTCREIDI